MKPINLGLVRVVGSCDATKFVQILRDRLSEYGIDLETTVVGITTDGASVMQKFGKLLPVESQLCFAHGVHLAVCDVLYATRDQQLANFSIVEVDDEDEDYNSGFELVPDRLEIPLTNGFSNLAALMAKVRGVVRLFRRSPTKTEDYLRRHMEADGKVLKLVANCKTRWISTFQMVEPY